MTIPRDEKLRITQRVHAKWSEIYNDEDDEGASEASQHVPNLTASMKAYNL